jgi:hypothetical protein
VTRLLYNYVTNVASIDSSKFVNFLEVAAADDVVIRCRQRCVIKKTFGSSRGRDGSSAPTVEEPTRCEKTIDFASNSLLVPGLVRSYDCGNRVLVDLHAASTVLLD